MIFLALVFVGTLIDEKKRCDGHLRKFLTPIDSESHQRVMVSKKSIDASKLFLFALEGRDFR